MERWRCDKGKSDGSQVLWKTNKEKKTPKDQMAVLWSRIRGQRDILRLHLEFAELRRFSSRTTSTETYGKPGRFRAMFEITGYKSTALWPIISPRKLHHRPRRPCWVRSADRQGITENCESFLRQTVDRAAAENIGLKMVTPWNSKAWKSKVRETNRRDK